MLGQIDTEQSILSGICFIRKHESYWGEYIWDDRDYTLLGQDNQRLSQLDVKLKISDPRAVGPSHRFSYLIKFGTIDFDWKNRKGTEDSV